MEKVGLTVKKIPDSDRDPDHHKIERFVTSETYFILQKKQ